MRAEHLAHQFADVPQQTFVDITFEAEHQVIGVVGRSGCGKTTLLRCLSGVIRPSEGTVSYSGRTPQQMIAARQFGFMFQSGGLLSWRPVDANVRLPFELGRSPEKGPHVEESVARALEICGVSKLAHRLPGTLSGGQRQRVALARAIVTQPDVLFLDEPLGALDYFTRLEVLNALTEAVERQRMTVVLVTHDLPEAVYMADYIYAMDGSPAALKGPVRISLDRPRLPALRETKEFREHLSQVMELLRGAERG